jgi:hypothetical protein
MNKTLARASEELRTCTELEYILLGDLRDLLEEPPSEENSRWLLAVLDALLDALPREFELKSQDGYLSEVLLEFPNWENHVERLEQQHVELFESLHDLREQIVARHPLEEIAQRLRVDLQEWLAAFVALHRQEQNLVLTAVNLEVGTGD